MDNPTLTRPVESLPDGVVLHRLRTIDDHRGDLTEIFREAWAPTGSMVQWNLVHSRPNTLRGVHVHHRHTDHVVAIAGRFLLGLQDVRPWSATAGTATLVDLGGDVPGAVTIPPGVAHGFFFPEASTFVYGVTSYWDSADEWGCRWDDPDLDIPWPIDAGGDPILLSPRDEGAPALASFLDEFLAELGGPGA